MSRNRLAGGFRILLTFTIAVITALPLFGQALHPNLERGFASDKAYSIGEIDHVNLFNGNVTVTLPLGGNLQIGEQLSLDLTLTYNSKFWETRKVPVSENAGGTSRLIPDRYNNAGLGWQLSLGQLLPPDDGIVVEGTARTYVSPDGAHHQFYSTLHGNEDPVPGIFYTRDSTYLRQTVETNRIVVEFPDGMSQEFESWMDGTLKRWRLKETKDRRGNFYTVQYLGSDWIITDQYGRTITVTFEATPQPTDGRSYIQPNLATAVKRVTLPGFKGTTARYEFTYEAKTVRRGYCWDEEPENDDPFVAVPVLRKIALFHGTTEIGSYEASYDIADPATPFTQEQKCRAGTLTSLKLPTKGSIEWTYGIYKMPGDCRSDLVEDKSVGVLSKKYKPATAGEFAGSLAGLWTYLPQLTPEPANGFDCKTTHYPGPGPSMEMTNTVTSPMGDETIHYFSVWPNILAEATAKPEEFGLPLSRRTPSSDGLTFISTRACEGPCSSVANYRRTTYVAYERDQPTRSPSGANARLFRTRTEHHDNGQTVPDWTETVFTNFDGVGHYRTETTTGNFGGGNQTRTVHTAYNQRDLRVSRDGSLPSTGPDFVDGELKYTLPPRWVLNTFTSVTTDEGGKSKRQLACFDPDKGELRGSRVLGGITVGPTDNLAVYERSTNTALNGGAPGFVTRELLYGGDDMPLELSSGDVPPLCDYIDPLTFGERPHPLSFDTRHTYKFGTRATTTPYDRNGASMGFLTLDLTVDPTGLAEKVRDTAGAETIYDYDPSGRIKSITPPGVARIDYSYVQATDSTRAKVITTQASTSGTVRRELHFDSLGRTAVEKKNVRDAIVSRTTTYNEAGWKTKVTEWDKTVGTRYMNFDAFGRARTIIAPDNSSTSVDYIGARQVSRTREYQSPVSNEATTTTTETYDPFGRLISVVENSGPTSVTGHVGDLVTTEYSYVVGDHLSQVKITPKDRTPQERLFTFDGRGLMMAEKQPELGNAEVQYAYDANGRPTRKIFPTASQLNLDFEYDAAGRPRSVTTGTGARLVKEFIYGTSGTALGRQQFAKRRNYLPGSSDYYLVTEQYQYNANGLVTDRTVNIDKVSGATTTPVRSFTHSRTYSDLGIPSTITYPQCTNCTSPNRTVAFDYDFGFLSAIPQYVNSILYAPSGMVTRVDHSNGVSDIITAPSNGMARPSSIRFESPCTPARIDAEPGDASVKSGDNVTLVATASGTAPLQYQWWRRAPASTTWTKLDGETAPTLITPVVDETFFRLEVTNACTSSPVQSREVRVTIKPTITTQPISQSAEVGDTPTLTVIATGTGPLLYRWYQGAAGNTSQPAAPESTSNSFTTPSLTETTSYWVRVRNDWGQVDSVAATLTVKLAAPTNLTAVPLSTNQIRLTWTASPNAAKYRIERKAAGSFATNYATVNAPAVTFTDTVELGKAYSYRVVALDQNGASESDPSNEEFASVYVFSNVAPLVDVTAKVFDEILAGINALRIAAGETTLTWANVTTAPPPANGVLIQAVYVQALRTQVNVARAELGFPPANFTGVITPAQTVIQAVYLTELQAALR